MLNACIRWLYWHKVFVWRNNVGGYKDPASKRFIRYGLPGSSDLLGIMPAASARPGTFIGIECKSDIGKLTEAQERFRDRIEADGGIYVLARSVDDLETHIKPLL